MTKSDPALKWLLENDPAAREGSRDAYLRDVGIIGATREGEMARHEVPLSDVVEGAHCSCCRSAGHARTHATR